MAIAYLHESATLLVRCKSRDDHGVVCDIYQAGTVNGTKYWFQKMIDGKVILRRSTMVLKTVREWMNVMEEAAQDGDVEVFLHRDEGQRIEINPNNLSGIALASAER